MIIFKTVRWKNFLSTGNSWTEMQLNANKSTLIVGQNGAGKSTMLDAISFALFGKPHRSINKPQLINSINNKDCIVEVSFSIGKSEYKVVRGIKPQIFEIWKNSTLINQSSHAKEYQKILEQNILKLNHKSFHQVVVLGSSSFIPFMQLSAGHRREVIEDLLDINVFSKMNVILRDRINSLKEKTKDVQYQFDLIKNKIETQDKYIKDVRALTEHAIDTKKNKIRSNQNEISSLQEINSTLSTEIEGKQDLLQARLNRWHDKKQSLLQYSAQFKQQISSVAKDAKFYEDNEQCPTCNQDISEETRSKKLSDAREKAKELKSAMDRITEESVTAEQAISESTESLSEVRDKQSSIHSNNQQITRLQNEIRALEEDITGSVSADLKSATQEQDKNIERKRELVEEKFKISEEYSYNEVMSEMLKDTGIKTKIIKQYIPVINKLVNQYLQILDFFVHFNLDESFSEVIRSRHRDEFTYESFSEGEKQRIDLSLLFTWRQIAKMKNSVATNLLILDETFDSSLDHDGVDNLLKILYTLGDDTNIFVISHKGEILDGKFNAKIEFKKEKNFSKIAS